MADRFDFFFRQKVTEAELDGSFDELEAATRSAVVDAGLVGVTQAGGVSEKSGTPDLTVDVAGSSVAYDKLGQRVAWGPVQNVDVSVDENSVSTAVGTPGNEKIVSVFAKFERALTNPRVDGNSLTVFFDAAESFEFVVRQGAESGAPATPPALDAEYILLADITFTNAKTQVLDADINTDRTETVVKVSAGALDVAEGTVGAAVGEVLTHLNNHVLGVASEHPLTAITFDTTGMTWADTTAFDVAAVNGQLAIAAVVTALRGTSGSAYVGAAAYTGSNYVLAAGTIQSQLREFADIDTHLDLQNFNGGLAVDAPIAETGTTFTFRSASHSLTFGSVSDRHFVVNAANERAYVTLGTTTGVVDTSSAVFADQNVFGGSGVDSNEAPPLVLRAGASDSGDGAPIIISPGSVESAGAVTTATVGQVILDFNRNSGTEQRRSYIPTLTHRLNPGETGVVLTHAPGAGDLVASLLNAATVAEIEAHVFYRGEAAGVANNFYGTFVRRATAVTAAAGGLPTVGWSAVSGTSTMPDVSGTLLVEIRGDATLGFAVHIDTPTGAGSTDAIWWAMITVTALRHTTTPDVT